MYRVPRELQAVRLSLNGEDFQCNHNCCSQITCFLSFGALRCSHRAPDAVTACNHCHSMLPKARTDPFICITHHRTVRKNKVMETPIRTKLQCGLFQCLFVFFQKSGTDFFLFATLSVVTLSANMKPLATDTCTGSHANLHGSSR